MGEISVSSDFQQFCKNLRMSDKVVSNIQSRYRAITKRINHDFCILSLIPSESRKIAQK